MLMVSTVHRKRTPSSAPVLRRSFHPCRIHIDTGLRAGRTQSREAAHSHVVAGGLPMNHAVAHVVVFTNREDELSVAILECV